MQNNSTSQRLPNSPSEWPAEAFPIGPTLAAIVGFVLVYVGTTIVLLKLFHVTPHSAQAGQLTLPLLAVQIFGYIPPIAFVAIVLPLLARRSLDDLFGGAGTREIVGGLIGAGAMWAAVIAMGGLQAIFVHNTQTQLAIRLFESATPGVLLDLLIFVALVLAPFTEELIFRAFVFNAIRRRIPFWPAAVVSGLIFGAAHGEAAGILPLAAGGIVLANVYARTGSLWSSIIAHGTFNAITLLLMLGLGIKS